MICILFVTTGIQTCLQRFVFAVVYSFAYVLTFDELVGNEKQNSEKPAATELIP